MKKVILNLFSDVKISFIKKFVDLSEVRSYLSDVVHFRKQVNRLGYMAGYSTYPPGSVCFDIGFSQHARACMCVYV